MNGNAARLSVSSGTARNLARAAGWASLGVALTAVAAPGLLERAFGLGARRPLVYALGARDLVVGAGLAFARDPAPWMRARLASEVLDAALHASGALTGHFHRRALAVGVAAAGVAVVDYAVLSGLRAGG